MPIYEYECDKCGEKFELRRGFNDSDSDIQCPKCGEKDARKVFSAFGVASSGGGCAPSTFGGST